MKLIEPTYQPAAKQIKTELLCFALYISRIMTNSVPCQRRNTKINNEHWIVWMNAVENPIKREKLVLN